VLTSPPYGCEVGDIDKSAWHTGRHICPDDSRNYSRNKDNIGHTRGRSYAEAMLPIYQACAAITKAGGFVVVITKNASSTERTAALDGWLWTYKHRRPLFQEPYTYLQESHDARGPEPHPPAKRSRPCQRREVSAGSRLPDPRPPGVASEAASALADAHR
jgi:hypothetical protein